MKRKISVLLALAMMFAELATPFTGMKVYAESNGADVVVSDNEIDTDDADISEDLDSGTEMIQPDAPENEDTADTKAVEEAADSSADLTGEKPSGTPVATAELGTNVTGSIYNEGGKVILYIDGEGTKISTVFSESALKDHAVTDLRFGGNVSEIPEKFFKNNQTLNRLEISSGIVYIGRSAFAGCSELTSMEFSAEGGSLTFDYWCFNDCKKLDNVLLPGRLNKVYADMGGGVIFGSGCESLKKAGFMDGATEVPAVMFARCKALKEVILPAGLKSIHGSAFSGCDLLTEVKLPEGLLDIGDNAFYGDPIVNLSIPGSVTDLGYYVFKDCKQLEKLTFEKGSATLEIRDACFGGCDKLDNVILPARCSKDMATLGSNPFSGCKSLTKAAIEEGATYIPRGAFGNCPALKEVSIPSTVTQIGNDAFKKCESLEKISIPDKVEDLAMYTFNGCGALTEIKLPKNLKKVGYYAFAGCDRLTTVNYSGKKTKEEIKKASDEGNDPLWAVEWIKGSGDPEEDEPVYTDDEQGPMNPYPRIDAVTDTMYLVVGQKFFMPETGWKSDTPSVVAVSKKGLVNPKKATSTAVTLSKAGRTSIKVYVSKPEIDKTKTLNAGAADTINLSYDSAHLTVLWESSNNDVVTVAENGSIKAGIGGKAVVTAHINGMSYKCKVTVREQEALADRTIHINLGDKPKAVKLPKVKGYKWSLQSGSSVEIAAKGKKIKGIAAGKSTVVATGKDGKTYTVQVVVEDITLSGTGLTSSGKNKYKLSMSAGQTATLNFKSVEQPVSFKSSKAATAYDMGNLSIKARQKGKTKLTATVNGKKITINVTVS